MCGWPSGVGYPPADGELENAAQAETNTDSNAGPAEPDHVGVQLDALAGMVARQGQPLTTETTDATTTDTPAAEPEIAEPDPADEAVTAESDVDAVTETIHDEPKESPDANDDVDPLTAPLAELTADAADVAETREPAVDIEPVEPVDTAPAEADLSIDTDETATDNTLDRAEPEHSISESFAGPAATTAGRTAAILRPAQLLIIGTAVLNLVLVGLGSVVGSPSGGTAFAVLGLALITLATWTGAAVTFLHWVSRAHTHVATAAASRQRHGSSMSLLGWFIPIAGFVIGYRVLQDLWTGSDPSTREDADAAPAKVRMIDAWLLGIVTAALFGYAMPLALGESAIWGALSALGLLAAALSLVSVMSTISSWQATTDTIASSNATADETTYAPTEAAAEPAPAPEPVSVSAE